MMYTAFRPESTGERVKITFPDGHHDHQHGALNDGHVVWGCPEGAACLWPSGYTPVALSVAGMHPSETPLEVAVDAVATAAGGATRPSHPHQVYKHRERTG